MSTTGRIVFYAAVATGAIVLALIVRDWLNSACVFVGRS